MVLEERYITVTDASIILGVSESTTRRYINRGLIPAIRLYGKYLIDSLNLDKAIENFSISAKEAAELSGYSSSHVDSEDATSPEHVFLTVKEAAYYLRISPKTVYRKVSDRCFPSTKIGGKILIRQKDLDDFLSSCTPENADYQY